MLLQKGKRWEGGKGGGGGGDLRQVMRNNILLNFKNRSIKNLKKLFLILFLYKSNKINAYKKIKLNFDRNNKKIIFKLKLREKE